MEQQQSKECADKKGTYSLSAQDAKSEINELQQLVENGGPVAVSEYIDANLNEWKTAQIQFAITGLTGTGKSTYLNKIRDLNPGDANFAETGGGDSTTVPKSYAHPTNDKIIFWDLPGYSTLTCKKEDYISAMKISDYHFFFIFFIHVLSEDDIWLVRELRKVGKPFALVRSKIDADIGNAKKDGKKKEMIIPEIKGKIQRALDANPELKDTKGIYLISSHQPDLGEMSNLMTYVEENIGGIKAQAFFFSLPCITKEVLKKKHKMLKKRLFVATALAAGVAAAPVPGVDVAFNTALLVYEVRHYMSVFGIEKERVNSLTNFNHSLLKCRSLLTPNFDMTRFVVTKISAFATLLLAQSFTDMFLPLIGSVISSVTTAGVTYTFLSGMLQDIKDDAELIYEHIMNINADHRI